MYCLLMTFNGLFLTYDDHQAEVRGYLHFYLVVVCYCYITAWRSAHLETAWCQHFHKTKENVGFVLPWEHLGLDENAW